MTRMVAPPRSHCRLSRLALLPKRRTHAAELAAAGCRRLDCEQMAFTLVEILVVLAVIAIIAAIIFPAFASARGKARQITCVSNLRQVGMAVLMYAQDYDDRYPFGADPTDLHTNIWASVPQFLPLVQSMKPLNVVMDPYVRSPDVWRCPSDFGFSRLDDGFTGGGFIPLDAHPTCFQAFGMSYVYRTEITLRGFTVGNLVAYKPTPPYEQVGPADINLLMDANGSWHGAGVVFTTANRYNVLMADGHAVNRNLSDFSAMWKYSLKPLP